MNDDFIAEAPRQLPPVPLARPAIGATTKLLIFKCRKPISASLDPVWTTATVALPFA